MHSLKSLTHLDLRALVTIALLTVLCSHPANCFGQESQTSDTKASTPRITGPACSTQPAKNREEWLVGSIGKDIAEILIFAAQRRNSEFSPAEIIFTAKQTDGAKEAYSFSLSDPVLKSPIQRDFSLDKCIFEIGNYSEFARQLLTALNLQPSPASACESEEKNEPLLLEKLSDTSTESLFQENDRISYSLTKDPLNPELHEQAALILAAFTLRDQSGAFYDPVPGLARMTAHLAIAKAMRNGQQYGLCGRLADAALVAMSSRDAEALEKAIALEPAAKSPVELSWVRMLKIASSNDYRLVGNSDTTPIEEQEANKRVVYFGNSAALIDKLAKQKTDTIAIGTFRAGQNGSNSVGTGHIFQKRALAAELDDFFTDYKRWHHNSFNDLTQLPVELNRTPSRCLVQEGGPWELRALSWDDVAAYHCREILCGFIRTYIFEAEKFGDNDETKNLISATTRLLGRVHLFPLVFTRVDCQDPVLNKAYLEKAEALTKNNPELVTSTIWSRIKRADKAAVSPEIWFGKRPLFGTAMEFFQYDGSSDNATDPMDLKTLDYYRKIAPTNHLVCEAWTEKKYGSKPTAEQWEEGYAAMFPFYRNAQWTAANAVISNPEKYIARVKEISKSDSDALLDLATYCAKHGRAKEAAKYFDEARKAPTDAVGVANISEWFVDYWFNGGMQTKAREIAEEAAEVYSKRGLLCMAHLCERTERINDAEIYYERIKDRYKDEVPLAAFYVRHAKESSRFGRLASEYLTKFEPRGFAKFTTIPTHPPTSGMRLNSDQIELGSDDEHDVKKNAVVVGMNGYAIRNANEYYFIKNLTYDGKQKITYWNGKQYKQVVPDKLWPPVYGSDFRTSDSAKTVSLGGSATAAGADSNSPPTGLATAQNLYNQKQYAKAAILLNDFVKRRIADSQTHYLLGKCEKELRHYDKAIAEYKLVMAQAPSVALRQEASAAARDLEARKDGICPGHCLKLSSPGWEHIATLDPNLLWMKFTYNGGWKAWSQRHLGEVIEFENGMPVNKGRCPICNGTGKVPRL